MLVVNYIPTIIPRTHKKLLKLYYHDFINLCDSYFENLDLDFSFYYLDLKTSGYYKLFLLQGIREIIFRPSHTYSKFLGTFITLFEMYNYISIATCNHMQQVSSEL